MAIKQSELIMEYIAGELLALAKHEGIPVVKVTIDPPHPDRRLFPTNYSIYQFWLDDKFILGQYFYNKENRWYTNTRSMCKENKQLTEMMQKYFPDGIVDKDTVKKLSTSSIKNFSEYAINKLNDSPHPFLKELLKLMGEDVLSQQSIANEIFNLDKLGWDLINKVSKDKVPTPIDPFYKDLGLTDLKTIPSSNVCWNSLIRYNDNNLVIESKDGNIYIYKKRSSINKNFSRVFNKCFSRSIHERILRLLIRRRPDLNYSDEELRSWEVNRQELTSYINTHPEILDTSDDDSLANFSERIKKCFSSEPYTQTYEVSVSLDINKHPEMDPKHHQADEFLPDSLARDLNSIGVNCRKTGFDGDDRTKYTILEFDIEREPIDRYSEVTKYVTDKLMDYGFDPNRINITKWD